MLRDCQPNSVGEYLFINLKNGASDADASADMYEITSSATPLLIQIKNLTVVFGISLLRHCPNSEFVGASPDKAGR